MPKSLQWVIGIVLGVSIGAAGYFAFLRPDGSPPAPGAGVEGATLQPPASFWDDAHEMVPPVHLPQPASGNGKVRVFVSVPEGAQIRGVEGPEGPSLAFPPGSIADRVEYRRKDVDAPWQVADVRGTTLEASGSATPDERFHLYRPQAPGDDSTLLGYKWRRGDATAQENVTALFTHHLRHGRAALARLRKRRLDHVVDVFADTSKCARCHAHHAPEATTPPPIPVRRRADANGFYTPLSVLFNAGPPEFHRSMDLNGPDPFVDVMCKKGGEAKEVTDARGGRRFSCGARDIAYGTFRIDEARAAGDEHAAGVCRSRRYLFDHLDDAGRTMFQARFSECDITAGEPAAGEAAPELKAKDAP